MPTEEVPDGLDEYLMVFDFLVYEPEVMGSNPSWVKFGEHSPPVFNQTK